MMRPRMPRFFDHVAHDGLDRKVNIVPAHIHVVLAAVKVLVRDLGR